MAGEALASVVGQLARIAPAARIEQVDDTADLERRTVAETGNVLPQEAEKSVADGEEIREAVSQLNEFVQGIRRELQFSVDEDSGRTVIRVYNTDTDELVRQIPSEEVLQAASLIEASVGLILKEQV